MSAEHYIVRQARIVDVPAVGQLDSEAFASYGTAEDPDIIRARLQVFPEGFLVVEEDGSVLGFGSSEKWLHYREPALNEDPRDTHRSDGTVLCITGMAVKATHRNRGIGSAILARLVGVAREHRCEQVVLETTHAQRFYEKYGFRVTGERHQGNTSLTVMAFDLEVQIGHQDSA